jgi:single-strand DNA-binding protein
MLALSLWQPWATLVAVGAKRIETRSWRYKGEVPVQLAIHATKTFPPAARALCSEEPYQTVLRVNGYRSPESLPLGRVLATCTLLQCVPVETCRPDDYAELAFGDYTPGRFGWLLDDVRRLDPPVQARGAQGLWRWEPPVTGPVPEARESETLMANLNKVVLIGRLTRDPEVKAFQNGGKVAKFGFAVNNRRKNQSTGNWEDEPVFLNVEVFNRGQNGTQADLVEQSLRKGSQVFLEGHLRLDQWKDKDGNSRQQLVVVCDNFQFLDPKQQDGQGNGRPAQRPQQRPASSSYYGGDDGGSYQSGGSEGEIPF